MRLQQQDTNCDALLFIYSVDSPSSFDDILVCMDEVVISLKQGRTTEPRRLPVILVANKIDLVRRRVISFEGLSLGVGFLL